MKYAEYITPEVRSLKSFIEKQWSHLFQIELEVPLKELFEKPETKGLVHIWKYGRCDLVVRQRNRLKAIFELHGNAHWNDERQMRNDKLKWALAANNNIHCVCIYNRVQSQLSNRQLRKLVGRFLFGSYQQ